MACFLWGRPKIKTPGTFASVPHHCGNSVPVSCFYCSHKYYARVINLIPSREEAGHRGS